MISFSSAPRFPRAPEIDEGVVFFWDRVDVFPRDTCLERRLASLEVASVVFGSNERENDEACGHTSDEDALDQNVV